MLSCTPSACHLTPPHCHPAARSTLYIGDVLVWRGFELCGATAELRAFWLQVGPRQGLLVSGFAVQVLALGMAVAHFCTALGVGCVRGRLACEVQHLGWPGTSPVAVCCASSCTLHSRSMLTMAEWHVWLCHPGAIPFNSRHLQTLHLMHLQCPGCSRQLCTLTARHTTRSVRCTAAYMLHPTAIIHSFDPSITSHTKAPCSPYATPHPTGQAVRGTRAGGSAGRTPTCAAAHTAHALLGARRRSSLGSSSVRGRGHGTGQR